MNGSETNRNKSGNPVRMELPVADLDQLSFCDSNTKAIDNWRSSLPMANTGVAAQQLYKATAEIATIKIDYATRMQWLELLRSNCHYIISRLDRNAVSANQHSDAIAKAAQKLQASLCMGYKVVIRDESADKKSKKPAAKELLPIAIHRALSDMSRILLRSLQVYVAPPENLWLELNQLYYIAEQNNLESQCVVDKENQYDTPTSIADAYLRSALLALCKPNQLRHRFLTHAFNALELWGQRVFLERFDKESLFGVDLLDDNPPAYANTVRKPAAGRSIRTDVLIYEIESYLKDIDSSVPIPDYVSRELLEHLVTAWGEMKPRSFRRAPATGTVKVCVGLHSTHFFLSGGVDFADQISETNTNQCGEFNPFMKDEVLVAQHDNHGTGKKDVWDDAFDLRVRIPVNPQYKDPELSSMQRRMQTANEPTKPEELVTNFEYFDARIADMSPGGYQLIWPGELPDNLVTGETLAIRDESDPRWCIAVVRWLRQTSEGTAMGVELLAPRAEPLAARVIMKKGGPTNYTRALLLPELKPINQPATLVTPKLPFQADQKIHLHRDGTQQTAQLLECTLKTESFNQFTFRMLDGYLENSDTDFSMNNLSELIGEQDSAA